MTDSPSIDFSRIMRNIKAWADELGFSQVGVSDCDTKLADQRLQTWLDRGFHGEMHYMATHRDLRRDPAKLTPNTIRIISVRMDYLTPNHNSVETLRDKNKAYISRYALGRDYHKVIRSRLTKLAEKINQQMKLENFIYRAFADSAPVFERHFAQKSGMGWIGKNTMILNQHAGSWFFLGELLTNLPLPLNEPVSAHCGSCTACIDVCPTKAIVAPYQIDARRCISYLTIEYKGSIDPALRPLMGNRIYGCDDCQLFCPWNKFAALSRDKDFQPRHGLATADLISLFAWDEITFLKKTEGSAMRRAGYINWLRNIAIALGNADKTPQIISALESRASHASEIVREHVAWAITPP